MIDSKEHRTALKNIAEKLSPVQQGVPRNEKGEITETYLEYLSLMYDPETAEIVQHLQVAPNGVSLEDLAEILNRDKEELKTKLEPLIEKGFIFSIGVYSIPPPLMIFDVPFILKVNYEGKDAKKLAELSRHYFEKEGYYRQWETSKKGNPRARVLTVSEKIESSHDIIPVEEVYKIINKYSSFALIPCPCRQRTEVEGIRKCKDKYPINNCLIVGPMADVILSFGDPVNRKVTKKEVKKIVKEAAELGLVHTTDNYVESTILCQCCECCCGLLAGLTRPGLDNSRAIARANYIASVNENCVACGTCLDRCKFDAINVEDIAMIDKEGCLGCGLCAVTCPNEAIYMKRLEREHIHGT